MAKTIAIKTEDGKEYTLEYTRKTIQQMESKGFKIQELDSKPMTMLPEFFAGAFLAHHKFVKREVIDDIFHKMKNKDALLEALGNMYNEPLLALMDEPDESEGNIDWKMTE